MRRVIGRILATIGAVVVGLVVLGAGARLLWRGRLPPRTILEVDLDVPLAEFVPDDPLAGLLRGRRPRLRDVLDALQRAATDDHVLALVGHISTGAAGLGQIQELRDAVVSFRAGGKRAVAFGEAFGESGSGQRRLLPRHRLRRDLPPAVGRRRPHRPHGRDALRAAGRSTSSASFRASARAASTRRP